MPDFIEKTKKNFDALAENILSSLENSEEAILGLTAENSDFLRFNNNKVRQSTSVEQRSLSLQLQKNGRTTKLSFSLTGHLESDTQKAVGILASARQECLDLPEDPYQVSVVNNGKSQANFSGKILDPVDAISAITEAAYGSDMAGLYCAGPIVSANKNSKGQDHWFATNSFFIDYSLYNGEKAVKSGYADTVWKNEEFTRSLQDGKKQLELMGLPKKSVPRGEYRTYLAPAAVSDLLGLFGWNGISYGDYKRGNSALKKLGDGEKTFSPLFHLRENFQLGLAPRFNSLGELAPEQLTLIEAGKLKNWLVSSRSAKEFHATSNNATEGEYPQALELLPGTLKRENILKEIGTGLYLSNLHYLNWSDKQMARVTGMTRYACFWVENGEIKAPISDLRFDETMYDCFGSKLLSITDFQDIDPETGTYEARSLGGKKNPGILVDQFKFTL